MKSPLPILALLILVVVAILVGWFLRHRLGPVEGSNQDQVDDQVRYERVPDSIPRWAVKERHPLPGGMPGCLAVGGDGMVYASVSNVLYRLDPAGRLESRKTFSEAIAALATRNGSIAIAFESTILILDKWDSPGRKTPSPGDGTRFVALAWGPESMAAFDFGHRVIWKFRPSGEIIGTLKHTASDREGILILPSPQAGLTTLADGGWVLTNPGRLRVEFRTSSGEITGTFGEPGMGLDQFPGCCNPVGVLALPHDRYVTWQKGLKRVLVHDRKGKVQSAILTAQEIGPDEKHLAMAVHANGEVLITDGIHGGFAIMTPPPSGNR